VQKILVKKIFFLCTPASHFLAAFVSLTHASVIVVPVMSLKDESVLKALDAFLQDTSYIDGQVPFSSLWT
jgi:hypothetical protein